MSTTSSGPTRRTLVKGAAWSVPVVAVAGAAPAAAASQTVVFENLGQACKLPGNSCNPYRKGYLITTRVCTTVRGTVTIDFGSATGTLCGARKTWTVTPDPLTIQGPTGGGEVCQVVNIGLTGEPNSANCPISGSAPFTWTSSNGLSGSGVLTFSAPATPPCDKCQQPAAGSSTTTETTTTQAVAPEATETTEPAPSTEVVAPTSDVVEPSTDAAATTQAP